MAPHPLRLIVVAYAVAALAGVGVGLEFGWWIGLLVAWLGGPLLVLTLPKVPGLGRIFAARPERGFSPTLEAAELRAWERDLEDEAAQSAAREKPPLPRARAG